MTAHVAQIGRHPVKSLGAERIVRAELTPGRTLPWDRVWALAHEKTRFDFDVPEWRPCQSFLRGSIAPLFAAVSARVDEASGRVTFRHPQLPDLEIDPDTTEGRSRFLDWVRPLCPDGPGPLALARVPGRGMTDTDFPSVSVKSLASLRDLSARMGVELAPRRFRGNFWVEGLEPWVELGWIGREITLGSALLKVVEPVVRCNLTKTNPETGVRDADTLGALEAGWGHKNFGVYCQVIEGGPVAEGDDVDFAAECGPAGLAS